jgi:hypothetical protein
MEVRSSKPCATSPFGRWQRASAAAVVRRPGVGSAFTQPSAAQIAAGNTPRITAR